MADPPSEPAAEVAPGEAAEAPGEAAETTQDPPEVPAAASPPESGHSGDRLDRIESTMAGLVDIVAALAPKDKRPTKLPWTHRFGKADETE